MRRILLALLFALAPHAVAQPGDPADYVRALYARYLRYEPPANELQFWLKELRRGESPLDVHANILGSDGYYNRQGRNDGQWLAAVYSEALGRPASADEIARGAERLQRYRGDRVRWAKEFLRNNNGRAPQAVAVAVPGAPPIDVPGQLVASAQLLAQSTDGELPGSRGWLVKAQANQIAATAQASRAGITDAALREMEAAANAIRRALNDAGYAPTCRLYFGQITTQLESLRQSALPGVPPPPLPPGGMSPAELEPLRQQATATARDTQRLANVLRQLAAQSFAYGAASRDADALDAEVDALRSELRPGVGQPTVLARLAAIRNRLGSLGGQIGPRPADGRLAQAWVEVQNETYRLLGLMGADPNPNLPVPPGPLPAGRDIVTSIDGAVAQIDVFGSEIEPWVRLVPVAGQTQAAATDVRNALIAIRQQATRGNPAGVSAGLMQLQLRQQRLALTWQAMASTPGMPPNPPDLAEINAALNRVQRAAGR